MKLFAVALAALLAGCGQRNADQPAQAASAPPPVAMGACSHPLTTAAVVDVIRRHYTDGDLVSDPGDRTAAATAFMDGSAPMSLLHIRTIGREEAINRSACEAMLRIGVHEKTFETLRATPSMWSAVSAAGWVEGPDKSATVSINYTSQPSDDKNSVFVFIAQGKAVAPTAGMLAAFGYFLKQLPKPAQKQSDLPDECAGVDMSVGTGLQLCAERQFEVADKALNATYTAAMQKLPADRQVMLRTEQRAWLAKLHPECQAQEEKDGMGGTAATLNIFGCMRTRTDARTAQIQSFK